jgi:hypothetical protein
MPHIKQSIRNESLNIIMNEKDNHRSITILVNVPTKQCKTKQYVVEECLYIWLLKLFLQRAK